MTSNRTLKRLIRKHMEETGLCYLDAKRSFEAKETLELAIDLSRANEPRFGQVIAVASQGGAGRSTVAVGLASYLAKASKESVNQGLTHRNGDPVSRPLKVALVDLDLTDGRMGYFTGSWKPTLESLVDGGVSAKSIKDATIYDEGLEIDLLLAPRSRAGIEGVSALVCEELIKQLRSTYDYIILDTPVRGLNPLMRQAVYPNSDMVLFVTESVATSLRFMTMWATIVTEPLETGGIGFPSQKIGIVVNKLLKGSKLTGKKIQDSAGEIPILSVIPANSAAVGHAANINSMERIIQDETLSPAFRRLAGSVVGARYPLAELSAD